MRFRRPGVQMTTVVSLAVVLITTPARASLTAAVLHQIGVEAPAEARVPMAVQLHDDAGGLQSLQQAIGGRPAIMIFADYTCQSLCGAVLTMAATGLLQSGLKPNADFRLIVVGLDPKDGVSEAQAMKRAQVDGSLQPASTFLLADAGTKQIADAVGYRYAYDSENDQFAHPAAVFVLAADGRVVRVLSGLALDPGSLRLALVEAGAGRVGTFADHVRLLCYGFDPAAGTYTAAIGRWLAIAAAATLLVLGACFMLLMRAPAASGCRPPTVPPKRP